MTDVKAALHDYAERARELIRSDTTAEETYYPAIRELWAEVLRARSLPFDLRTGTSEQRETKGTDRPDLAFYDSGQFVALFGEVKLPGTDLRDLAVSTDNEDQIGRYLGRTGAVLLTNIHSVGLLTTSPTHVRQLDSPVAPDDRDLVNIVELWPNQGSLARGEATVPEAVDTLADLIEQAVTQFAPIASPSALARILARQARAAKAELPEGIDSATLAPLYNDFHDALGLSFDKIEGANFFRSSLVQTVFYSLFAAWTLWHRGSHERPFHWRDVADYLRLPFIGGLFHEIENPTRLRELNLRSHLDRAVATLLRVDKQAFFTQFSTFSLELPDEGSPSLGESSTHGRKQTAAITYFYEPFLEAFDPELREDLGVWYTPPEVVEYQVRKVHALLKNELGCPKGFADERVAVLDPCCGTGAYLLSVTQCIAEELQTRGEGALIGKMLAEALSKRVIGFEILPAPFVVSQLQLYMLLTGLGVDMAEETRPAVYLTNALTGWSGVEHVKLNFPELIEEREKARDVKCGKRIVVVLGNPPYNRFSGVAMDEEGQLVDRYKGIKRRQSDGGDQRVQDGPSELYTRFGIRKHLLDDLYIRFFRLADRCIGEDAEYGVVSYISNSSYLVGRSHPLMRESLLSNFHSIWIDELNGDKYKTGKVIPEGLPGAGTSDQSIFTTPEDPRGIQVGTTICTLLRTAKEKTAPAEALVWHRSFWGKADAKRAALIESLELDRNDEATLEQLAATPEGPRAYEEIFPTLENRWIFAPYIRQGGFDEWPSLDELFPVGYQGVNPNRGLEGSVIDMSRSNLAARMKGYYSTETFDAVLKKWPELVRARARYEPEAIWEDLREHSRFETEHLVEYLLFPFDSRFIYYETEAKLLNERRPEYWENLEDNGFLIAVPQPRRASESLPLFTRTLADLHVHDRGSVCFPASTSFEGMLAGKQANVRNTIWSALRKAWGLRGDLASEPALQTARNLQLMALAIMHSPQYQLEHKEALALDWASIPIPRQMETFKEIADSGQTLATLFDVQQDAVGQTECAIDQVVGEGVAWTLGAVRVAGDSSADLTVTHSYFGASRGQWYARPYESDEPSFAEWGKETGDLHLNGSTYLANVPEKVWTYELGGYPVIKKWLGYRQASRRAGAPLAMSELHHLRSIVQRIAAVLVLQKTLDGHYEAASSAAFTRGELGLT